MKGDQHMDKTDSHLVRRRSLIKEFIPPELFVELEKITIITGISNSEKGLLIKAKLKEYDIPYNPLGSGTNRYGIQIDSYALKIALDKDGKVDNRREMKYSKQLQPYVVKVYECTTDGLISVSEYVRIFSEEDMMANRPEMRRILKEISTQYLIGDVGISRRNYINWGFRRNGQICIMDFAYIYDVKYNTFKCTCDEEGILSYDSNYNDLICPACGRKFSFGEIRRRISRKAQEEDIGDIREVGYCLKTKEEFLDYDESKEGDKPKPKEKKISNMKRARQLRKERLAKEKVMREQQD